MPRLFSVTFSSDSPQSEKWLCIEAVNRSRRRESALTVESARTDVRGYVVHGKPVFAFAHVRAWHSFKSFFGLQG